MRSFIKINKVVYEVKLGDGQNDLRRMGIAS
jgi:hypothetical protein